MRGAVEHCGLLPAREDAILQFESRRAWHGFVGTQLGESLTDQVGAHAASPGSKTVVRMIDGSGGTLALCGFLQR